jgi:opacity protein-like surface antigen
MKLVAICTVLLIAYISPAQASDVTPPYLEEHLTPMSPYHTLPELGRQLENESRYEEARAQERRDDSPLSRANRRLEDYLYEEHRDPLTHHR